MTTMTQPATPHPVSHSLGTTVAGVVAAWLVAAVLLVATHLLIEPRAMHAADVLTVGAVLLVAFAYMRGLAPDAGVSHALGVGIAWLALSIATEILLTTRAGHPWFTLLGSPDRSLLRNVLLFAWIFSPALFARGTR